MELRIRDMTRADVDRAGAILYEAFTSGASKRGYAPRMQAPAEGKALAWTMLRHGPSVNLVVEADGQVVGVCTLNPRGKVGGFGPIAVDPRFQGRRIAEKLFSAILARATQLETTRCYQEAFNPASFLLLYDKGFQPVAELLELELHGPVEGAAEASDDIRALAEDDVETLHCYDGPRSTVDRRPDLRYFVRWGKIFVLGSGSEIRGYLACLPGGTSVQLGPLVAEAERDAEQLYRHALAHFAGRVCSTSVMARDRALVSSLRSLGFKLYCLDLLMARGPWRPGRSIEAFGRFPEGI